jgi:hypothetical protein
MATRKKAGQEKAEPEKVEQAPVGGEILQKTAKAIGSTLGAIAVKTGIAHPETPPKKKIPKLVKKAKQRLPRKAKKQAKKKLLAG